MWRQLRRTAAEWQLELRHLLDSRYADFVLSRQPQPIMDDVPVFVLHTIDTVQFEKQLSFLVENGYRGLTCDGFLDHLTGAAKAPPKSVLLTIDDGRVSVWTYGFPLLQRYQFPAVVFLIPGYIREDDLVSPTLEDVCAGRCSPSEVRSRDPELMSWAEIEIMARSGLVDFQSHTLYHHPVPISPKIVDYVNPRTTQILYSLPVESGRESQLKQVGIAGLYGSPIYENASLMSGQPIYRPDPRLTDLCIEHVARSGGASFFRSDRWRGELDGLIAAWRRQNGDGGRTEDAARDQRDRLDDLRRARRLIEQRLPGRRVRHLCYPYTIGSELAIQASKEAGYRTNFWGVLPDRRTNRPGQDPYRCPRLKSDYVFRLPGRGRRPLGSIFLSKLKRRLSGRPVY